MEVSFRPVGDLTFHFKQDTRALSQFVAGRNAVVRYGALSDSSLVAIPLIESNRRALCAPPDYLRKRSAPGSVDDLRRHNCLRFVWSEQVHERLRFTLPGGDRAVAVSGNRVSDNADALRRWAIDGQGLVYKSRLDLIPDIAAGRLVEVFPHLHCEPSQRHMICADRSRLTPPLPS